MARCHFLCEFSLDPSFHSRNFPGSNYLSARADPGLAQRRIFVQ
jgi:hypothetical protein